MGAGVSERGYHRRTLRTLLTVLSHRKGAQVLSQGQPTNQLDSIFSRHMVYLQVRCLLNCESPDWRHNENGGRSKNRCCSGMSFLRNARSAYGLGRVPSRGSVRTVRATHVRYREFGPF